ncbi:MAG: hypothetical protein ACRDA5_02500 [Clostridium sp.]
MEVGKEVIQLKLRKKLVRALTDYILANDLDLEKITINKLIANILNDWILVPKLDQELIVKIKGIDKDGNMCRRISVSLEKSTLTCLNRIHVKKYLYDCPTKTGLAINIIEQWASGNIDNYSIS